MAMLSMRWFLRTPSCTTTSKIERIGAGRAAAERSGVRVAGKLAAWYALKRAENLMKARDLLQSLHPPAAKSWSRSRVRGICPRRHLRVLPTRTRPSLFGGD
jgi:hypothetical protein